MTDAAKRQTPEELELGLQVLGCRLDDDSKGAGTIGTLLADLAYKEWSDGGWERYTAQALHRARMLDESLVEDASIGGRLDDMIRCAIGTLQDFARAGTPLFHPITVTVNQVQESQPEPPAPPETVTVDSEIVFSLFENDPGYEEGDWVKAAEREEGGWVKVAEREGDSGRWQQYMTMILRRVEDGKLFGVDYELGLTEYQDHTFPWDDSTTVELREIEARQVTRTVYRYRKG